MRKEKPGPDDYHAEDTPPQDEELQAALADVLGEDARAAELRQMAAALQHRRTLIMGELDSVDLAERPRLLALLETLDEQIAVLGEEAGITKFVEDSVRASLEMRRLGAG